MSSKRNRSPEFPLCRFAFADGRHCAHPAHPHRDGLCPSHFDALNRPPNSKNPARHLSPLTFKHLNEMDVLQVLSNLQEAVASQAVSPSKAATMSYIGNVLLSSIRDAKAAAFRKGTGPHWDTIRKLLDDPEAHLVSGS